MEFLQVYGFEITQGKNVDFQTWIDENEEALKAAVPDGVAYVGTYAAIYSTEKQAGSIFTVYRLTSYADLDRLAEALDSGELGRLIGESMSLIDFDNTAGWSRFLLKSITDATVWD
jgi:hypothetical protein